MFDGQKRTAVEALVGYETAVAQLRALELTMKKMKTEQSQAFIWASGIKRNLYAIGVKAKDISKARQAGIVAANDAHGVRRRRPNRMGLPPRQVEQRRARRSLAIKDNGQLAICDTIILIPDGSLY